MNFAGWGRGWAAVAGGREAALRQAGGAVHEARWAGAVNDRAAGAGLTRFCLGRKRWVALSTAAAWG